MAEKTAWRECEFAGGVLRDQPRPFRVCKLLLRIQDEDVAAEDAIHTEVVCPGDCGRCPVPALVEAVRASKEFLESRGVQAAFMLQGIHGGVSPWRKGGKLIDEWLDAALAALPKGEDRG